MNKKHIEYRLQKLSEFLDFDNQAILLTNDVNIGYFCDFFHSEGYLLISQKASVLFVDFRYYEAAKRYAVGCEVKCFTKLFEALYETVKRLSVNTLYFEASDLTVLRFNTFDNYFSSKKVECIANSEIDKKISDLRCIKDKNELENIIKAQQITEKAYLEVLNYLKPGISERSVAIELEHLIKLNGAEDKSFDLITITGKKTSLPHGVPSDDVVHKGDFFTFDIGSIYNGYHSDTTRTVAVNYADEEMCTIYDIVLQSQLTALDAVKCGVKCSDVDRAARAVIEENGYGEYFGHSTGHGVGLDIHEAPTVSHKCDTILQSGMIITDEPGIYLPNKFGVRIEDMLYVTDQGCKNLVTLPKELIIV